MKTKPMLRVTARSSKISYDYIEIIDGGEESITLNVNPSYTPVAGDKLYVYPGCVLPRLKLKGFCEANKIAVVKYKDKANIFVVNKTSILDEFFETCRNCYYIDKKVLISELASSSTPAIETIQELQLFPGDKVIIDNNTKWNLVNYCHAFGLHNSIEIIVDAYVDEDDAAEMAKVNCWDIDELHYFINPESKQAYLTLIANNIYEDKSFTSLLNETVIDEDMYKTLRSMFDSRDNANHTLAMETMANCNYLESAIYLLFLFKDYRSEMYNSRTRNHVNFKALCQFFNVNVSTYALDLDGIVHKLKDKDILTKEAMDILLPLAKEVVLESGNTEYFEMTDVKPIDSIIEIIERKEKEKLERAQANSQIEITNDDLMVDL